MSYPARAEGLVNRMRIHLTFLYWWECSAFLTWINCKGVNANSCIVNKNSWPETEKKKTKLPLKFFQTLKFKSNRKYIVKIRCKIMLTIHCWNLVHWFHGNSILVPCNDKPSTQLIKTLHDWINVSLLEIYKNSKWRYEEVISWSGIPTM